MTKYILNLTIILFLIPFPGLYAQQQKVIPGKEQDSLLILKEELKLLKIRYTDIGSRFDSLIKAIDKKEKAAQAENELQKLLDEASRMAAQEKETDEDLTVKFLSGVRQQQALNPNISLGGDFFGAISTSGHDFISEPGEVSYGNNGFFLREIEIGIEAPLDPFTRGKSFISVTSDEINIEEAYMEWLNLPLNMNLKIGIFYTEYGPLNRYHDHALPQFDRPRALVNLFSNQGLGGTGVSTTFMLPQVIFSDASSLDLSVQKGTPTEDIFSFGNTGFLYSGQFKNYYDINQDSYFEVRLSNVTGKNPEPGNNLSSVGSLGLSYKWVPAGREKYRTLDWKSELLYSYRKVNTGNIRSIGFYSAVQNKLNARFTAGARIGYSQLPYDNKQHEWDYTVNLDFWQSEFVFARIQYQYNHRNITDFQQYPAGMMPNDHSVILQVCWAMGPHKHEAY